jgi:hypothetical protein
MTIAIHSDLLAMIDAVEIRSPTEFTVRGTVRDILAQGQVHDTELAADGAPLVSALEEELYWRLYTRPADPYVVPIAYPMARRELMAALSAANTGRGTWEPGWTIEHLDRDGRVTVTKDGVRFWALQAGVRLSNGAMSPGQNCRVRVGKELRYRMSGYYIAIGDAEGDDGDRADEAGPVVRYYWHLTREAAVPFMAAATQLLNLAEVPFRLKVVVDPGAYRRADAGVLYVNRRYDRRLGDAIVRIHQCVASGLRREVPMLTKQVAHGLGLADDPRGSLSFGQHRCKLVAAALWRSFVNGEFERDRRAATLAAVFCEAGLDFVHPYLEPGSLDDCALAATTADRAGSGELCFVAMSPSEVPSLRRAADVPGSLVDAAIQIGESLSLSAIWDVTGRLCNWMGRPTSRDDEPEALTTLVSSALDPGLYAGSAGIALFLAQLHEHTGDPKVRRTALGAIERSIRQLHRQPSAGPVSPLSFYCGHLGVAFVCRRTGALLDSHNLDRAAELILEQVFGAAAAPHGLDLIEGNAGAILALLSLAKSAPLSRCLDLSIALGEELCRTAVHRESFWAREQNAVPAPESLSLPLTGLAHGASGIGLALYELHAATGIVDFLDFARSAFDYEDSLFEAEEGNWPDLRSPSHGRRFALAWCNGAPGIALARTRAAALDSARAERYRAAARIAIATTLAAIETRLAEERCDSSLCHGLAGLAEVVLTACQMLQEPCYRERALATATTLINRHVASSDWQSGATSGGPNPSLMLGLAGVGYWLLRLHNPDRVPSMLLLVP